MGVYLTVSLTSTLDGGGWSTPRLGRVTPGNEPQSLSIVQEAGWAGGPVWTYVENLAPIRDSNPEPVSL
jgi:hypothetical protein